VCLLIARAAPPHRRSSWSESGTLRDLGSRQGRLDEPSALLDRHPSDASSCFAKAPQDRSRRPYQRDPNPDPDKAQSSKAASTCSRPGPIVPSVMPVIQETLTIRTPGRGLREITREVADAVQRSGLKAGHVVVFCQHTSCSLVIMENADPSARQDLETFFERLAPDGDPRYVHDSEGPDDMSAHLRMALTRTSETIPFAQGRPLLGTWQGVFLWEHRTSPHKRTIIISIHGD